MWVSIDLVPNHMVLLRFGINAPDRSRLTEMWLRWHTVLTICDVVLEPSTIQFYTSLYGYGFSSGHVWMWQLDHKESWKQKNWCFWTVVLEKTLESPLDCKEIQSIHPKGDQFWVFTGRTDVEAETLRLWPPDAKSWLIGKDSDAGRD